MMLVIVGVCGHRWVLDPSGTAEDWGEPDGLDGVGSGVSPCVFCTLVLQTFAATSIQNGPIGFSSLHLNAWLGRGIQTSRCKNATHEGEKVADSWRDLSLHTGPKCGDSRSPITAVAVALAIVSPSSRWRRCLPSNPRDRPGREPLLRLASLRLAEGKKRDRRFRPVVCLSLRKGVRPDVPSRDRPAMQVPAMTGVQDAGGEP